MAKQTKKIEQAYRLAKERYAALGVDTDKAIKQLNSIPVAIHCWQGDDAGGFEDAREALGGGLAVTGNYPGKARTPEELRADFEEALLVSPGCHRFNLHACYAEMKGRKVDRDELSVAQFKNWIAWARSIKLGLDFNPTYFAHPKVAGGFTLTSANKGIRQFWIEHGIRCREIGAAIGKALGNSCLNNIWIPDGMKDTPADRRGPRERLAGSLDAILEKKISPKYNVDSVEPKLFGIGAESYTPGSHEFYLGYAVSRQILLTLDAGHYHPTEGIADKISSVLCFLPEIALHVSRGVRWDSDHVVTLTEELLAIAQEIVWGGNTGRVRIGLDYFDASINRVAAWVIGARNMRKALLLALVAPIAKLRQFEAEGDYTSRLALMEDAKLLPAGAVWDYYCARQSVPVGEALLTEVKNYERTVLAKRS
ncbi:MAG: L-rhamnose isomerase [Verrucomicrobia bacterium]|nr:L-rhamnose isomerase [Verrucomicrobiota bacterium]